MRVPIVINQTKNLTIILPEIWPQLKDLKYKQTWQQDEEQVNNNH